jgi:hypothetical protein
MMFEQQGRAVTGVAAEHGCRGGCRYVLVACLGVWLLLGCGTPPPVELPDPASGRILTLEEQYCRMLDDYAASLHRDLDLAVALGDSLGAVLDSLNAIQSELSRESRRLTADVARLKQNRGGAIEYTTREGDTLMKLASIFYDSNAEWRKIYTANQDKIQDPGATLPPGLKLSIPQ